MGGRAARPRETDQPPLWIATSDLPTSPGHPFYARLTTLLDGHHFDRFVEGLCDRFYAPVMGRPSLAPGRYFRLLLVGKFIYKTSKASTRTDAGLRGARRTRWRSAAFCGWPWTRRRPIIRRLRARGA